MNNVGEMHFRADRRPALWTLTGVGAAGVALAAVAVVFWGELLPLWLTAGFFFAVLGVSGPYGLSARVSADAYGLRSRVLVRRRSVAWADVADLRVRVTDTHKYGQYHRVSVLTRHGREWRLPLPYRNGAADDGRFDADVAALRALHRGYGAPESDHLVVVSNRTAGGGRRLVPLVLTVLLLAGAVGTALLAPHLGSERREWRSATPCAADTPTGERDGCRTTLPAVIAETDMAPSNRPRQSSWLYLVDGRPLERVEVSAEAAEAFRPGDAVELTLWRGQVREVVGERHTWREHVPGAGDAAVASAALALAAGYPAARLVLLRRWRRLPDDEVLPSALPFAGALLGTALWLLPLCYLRPTAPLGSAETAAWAAAGSLVTVGLLRWAWRATRVRAPQAVAPEAPAVADEDVFVSARFLEHTDYNPHGFGTHVVIGGGPPAVTPHPGPGRFAARPIPTGRLRLREVRRARGADGETVPRSWHVAEFDDAGTPVRLAAAPDDLARVVRLVDPAGAAAAYARPRPASAAGRNA
ncbi:PH domain-containing protein [Streptomyces millisiae]|uniref:PH domain-containing protein n=1 Tax=Streptomyces millisiae TaxID=3075542 RepID=A0ABU2LYV8_9ACTN|nr:PH domain-containing protein [Streptomyces sp. DSM 44918]MDT0322332.1 PH domain-containing protein [Streptomyces sp. DSM 44918]